MPLGYVLQQFGFKTGLNPADDNQRAICLRYANVAAKELYQTSDMAGCLDEINLKVNANQTIAMPDYVGHIRAMRESYTHLAVNLQQMRPRYNQYNWESEWRNWRLKNLSPLQTSLQNQSVLVLKVQAVEDPPISVTITGPSDGSSNMFETIVMDALVKQSVNQYNDIRSLTKTAVSKYDVQVCDADNNQISYIPSNRLNAQFQIVDISTAPWWSPNLSPLIGWVEVLYKKSLPQFTNDSDEFPAVGYDEVWINKMLQLYYEEQNNVEIAVAYSTKATQLLAQIHEDANRGTDDCVALVESGHDRMNHRVGFGRDWRYAYRITGR